MSMDSNGIVNWGTSNLMVVGALLSGVSAGNFSYMFRIYEKSLYSPQYARCSREEGL